MGFQWGLLRDTDDTAGINHMLLDGAWHCILKYRHTLRPQRSINNSHTPGRITGHYSPLVRRSVVANPVGRPLG